MPISLSDKLGIPSSILTDLEAFDPILDVDTHLFIDPNLLKYCDIEELKNSYSTFQKHFIDIVKVLNASDKDGDIFWRKAFSLMIGREVKGLCIGYSSKGTSGSGIGRELALRLLKSAKEITKKGIYDPELFEIMGLFEEDFGPDRISDMTANIIKNDLINYSKRIFKSLESIRIEDCFEICQKTGLPINPYNEHPIILVPQKLLRDLPVSLDWTDREIIAVHNDELRTRVNDIIGKTWRDAKVSCSKGKIKEVLLDYPELINDLIEQYVNKKGKPYDFTEDRVGEYIWYKESKRITKENPLELLLKEHPSIDEVEKIIIKICDKFKTLIEDNGLWQLLYDGKGKPKHEKAAQLLFYGISESYCESNNIMLVRESDAGRGPVDFKFGTYKENSIVVELKKSTNTSGLKKGITNQLPDYMKAEKTKRGIYLVIDVGYTEAAIENLREINKMITGKAIKIIRVDGNPKQSASK